MVSMFYNVPYVLKFTKSSGIFCGFGCPGNQDNTSLFELLVSLLIWCFLECSKVPGVGMFKVS